MRWGILILVLWGTQVQAAPTPPSSDKPLEFKERPLDGVVIEGVETYRNTRNNTFDFGLGLWPLSPYYNSFSVDVGYTHFVSKTYAWEVLRASYIYSVDKGLTSELADSYKVQPASIERLNYVLSTNLRYVLAYGKFIFFKEHIRYFRSNLVAGPTLAITSSRSTVGGDLGINLEVYANDFFSWRFELRDTLVTVGSTTNNLAISVGTVYAF